MNVLWCSECESSHAEVHPFFKDSYGRFIVLYSYHAQDENDLSVERGQCVTLLNKVRSTKSSQSVSAGSNKSRQRFVLCMQGYQCELGNPLQHFLPLLPSFSLQCRTTLTSLFYNQSTSETQRRPCPVQCVNSNDVSPNLPSSNPYLA